MKPFKSIILIALFFHFNSFALDSWNFVVNNTSLKCSGHVDDRFWLCKGDHYSGIIDRLPENDELKFLPMFMSTKTIELDLYFESWTNELGENLLENEEIAFNYRYYFDFNKRLTFQEELANCITTSKFPEDNAQIIAESNRFIGLIHEYFSFISKLSCQQEIYDHDHLIVSGLTLSEPYTQKKPNLPIPCLGKENLSLANQKKYEEITRIRAGHTPNLAEAEELFKDISKLSNFAFDYILDGCQARAHLIAYKLIADGFQSGKIWVAGTIKNPRQPDQNWSYHVAPLIFVRSPEGTIFPYVIDPSLDSQHLLTIYEWLEKLSIHHIKIVSFPLPPETEYFEKVVMAFSSHIPLWPFQYDGKISFTSTIAEAMDNNLRHWKLLQKNQ